MWLVVGLGNPGARYRGTRHNVGALLVDALAARWGVALRESTALFEQAIAIVGDTPVVLAKPRTFMNDSGTAVAALRSAHPAATIAVAYDDLDLPLGRVRVRAGGGTGGHRGVTSAIAAIGSDFVRLRIGIGRPPAGMDPVAFVLAPFAAPEHEVIAAALARAAAGVETLVREGVDAAMRACNGPPVSDAG